MQRMMVVLFAVLALAACSKQAPEVAVNDQVPADERTTAASEGVEGGGSEGDTGDGAGDAATWVAVDIDFAEAPAQVASGAEITLENQGSAQHNVTIEDNVIVEAAGGETATATLDLEPGTYDYVCSIPGHESLMNGKVEVTQ